MPTEAQLRDDKLRFHIRESLNAGQLPTMRPQRIYGGYGSGNQCAACDQAIEPAHIEYEVEDCRDGRRLIFHLGCYVIWQLECAQKIKAQVSPDPQTNRGKPEHEPPDDDPGGSVVRWWSIAGMPPCPA